MKIKLPKCRGRGDDESEEEEEDGGEELTVDEELQGSIRKSSWKSRLSFVGLFRTESGGELTRGTASGRDLATNGSSTTTTTTTTPPGYIHPHNWWYQVWTQFILLWAIYSSFFTPLEFGFFRGLPENLFLLDIAGQFAFLIDIFVRFFVSYSDPHSRRMVYNRKLIAIRYFKSRFLVDFLGCCPWDAIYRACGRKEPVRYLLWIRLSRALRVTEFFGKMEKDIRINYLFVRIMKLFVVELYCTHTAACIFYYLATTMPPSKERYTWIGSLQMGDYSYSHFREIDLWTRYVTSLYFAIVTMATVGYGEIHAVNVREMIFIMIYVSFDMIIGAYLLGNMAALIVKGSKTERFRDKMADLIKYMNTHKLGKRLSNEIKDHVRLQYENRYTEAALVQDIPISIRAKISQKLYEPYVKAVPLFNGCSLGFIKHISTKVHEEFFLPGEVIIEQGDIVDQLYLVCFGELEAIERSEDEETRESPLHLQTYKTHSSFGEISMLCNIPAPYAVRVCELSRLLRLDKKSLTDVLEIYFFDGRIILNNVLEGKESNLQNKLLESDITLHIGKHESELAMRLNCAAYDGDLHRLKRLIGAGADPNRTDYDGRSPLHVAASKGYEEITEFLIQKGVVINITDNFGNTPLLEAIKNGHDHIASLLVKAGASLTIENAGSCLCLAVARRDLEFLRRVLANGINPNSRSYDLRTPLHIAAAEGLYTMACLLLEAGASVFSKDRWGNTPLDEARIGGDKNLVKLLEEAKSGQLAEFSDCFKEIQDATKTK
ncbi:potassium channel KOR1-like [Camellia sinensis]|uniref:potassium channel KOR1-like n=1 Tax=Camellia sinensis TaxID=4442 RepID=UPI001036B051|nr:potassium channel KOR1-like [Camellia sinensis]